MLQALALRLSGNCQTVNVTAGLYLGVPVKISRQSGSRKHASKAASDQAFSVWLSLDFFFFLGLGSSAVVGAGEGTFATWLGARSVAAAASESLCFFFFFFFCNSSICGSVLVDWLAGSKAKLDHPVASRAQSQKPHLLIARASSFSARGEQGWLGWLCWCGSSCSSSRVCSQVSFVSQRVLVLISLGHLAPLCGCYLEGPCSTIRNTISQGYMWEGQTLAVPPADCWEACLCCRHAPRPKP